jgi:nitroimidazol reductase NimA-like FMN-containing flavoprotein (pyridoxamine 5'-phosphate oxidase superfamily)
MKDAVRTKITDILAKCRDLTIATVRPDGAPQATVVSYVHDGLLIYFGCGAQSQKAQNIGHERRVSVTVTLPYADWLQIRGLSLAGVASEVTTDGEKASVTKLMLKRFPEIASMEQTDPGSVKLFRVRPTLVSLLDYSQGFGHTDLVAVGANDITESRGISRHRWAASEWA